MATELLFLRDAYQRTVDATVLEVRTDDEGRSGVVLDRTVFYYTGGGQPNDTGVINGQLVVDVRKVDDVVVHWLIGVRLHRPWARWWSARSTGTVATN